MSVKFLDRQPLLNQLEAWRLSSLAESVQYACQHRFCTKNHGMLAQWHLAWEELPECASLFDLNSNAVTVGKAYHLEQDLPGSSVVDLNQLRHSLMKLHPWRKGPWNLFSLEIDSEWRSFMKWDRFASHINFRGKRILDIGAGNGYYGWKMLGQQAQFVLGCEPFLLSVVQFEVFRKYWPGEECHFIVPMADRDLPRSLNFFDLTLSMGVLYHHPCPIEHLQILCGTLKPKGQLVLETLVVDEQECHILVPENRYAKMRNVWFIPSVKMLEVWLRRTGFCNIETIGVYPTTSSEQRRTDWMTFESLDDFLDPQNSHRTIEGYPAPQRAILTAIKK